MNKTIRLAAFIWAVILLCGATIISAQEAWKGTATGGNTVTSAGGNISVEAMNPGLGYALRPRPYGLDKDYSVSFSFKLNTYNNHWLTVYFDDFIFMNIDWGTELKYWNGEVPGILGKLEANRTYLVKIEAHPSRGYYEVFLDGTKAGTAVDVTPGARGGGHPSAEIAPEGTILAGDSEGSDYNRGSAGWSDFIFPAGGAAGAVLEKTAPDEQVEEAVSDLDKPNEEAKTEPDEEKAAVVQEEPALDEKAPPTEKPDPGAVASVPANLLAEDLNFKDADVCQDDHLNGNNADWGGSPAFYVSSKVNGARNTNRRAFLWFDVHAVPWGADGPAKVELELNLAPSAVPGDLVIRAYRATGSWREGDGVYQPGKIAPDADEGIITWNFQPGWDSSKPWAEATVGDAAGPVRWDITELVKGWRSGRFPNHGLVLVGENEGTAGYSKGFVSSEGDDPELRPKIVLNGAGGKAAAPPDQKPPDGEEIRILDGVWNYEGYSAEEARHEEFGSWVFATKPKVLIAEWWRDFELRTLGHKARETVTYDLRWTGNGEGFVAQAVNKDGTKEVIEARWAHVYHGPFVDLQGRYYNVGAGKVEPDPESVVLFSARRVSDDPRK